MLDQSFSAENFRKILDYENRKGIYLEGKFSKDIVDISEKIKKRDLTIKEKILLKEQKEELLTRELEIISEKVISRNFQFELIQNKPFDRKPVYTIENSPEAYFALKQVQYNLRKLYDIKQANKFDIISQVKCLLEDGFPKFVVRTDIKNFYESIPHEKLLEILNEDNYLTFSSKFIINKILHDYRGKFGNTRGIPRGICISAYLAELYMQDLDTKLKLLQNVSYYARYVDDIIIIFTPSTSNNKMDYLNEIKSKVGSKGLDLNDEKTKIFDLIEPKKSFNGLNYLGYVMSYNSKIIDIKLTGNKIKKYKNRMDLIFSSYLNYSKFNEKKARKLLIKRLRFLTGNTRLLNNKKNILIGIYFSNSLITNSSHFDCLDKYLAYKIDKLIVLDCVKRRLNNLITEHHLTFKDGFEQKRFTPVVTRAEFSEIIKVWKYETKKKTN
jgi:hypothetical protein